ncbi:hypothetical protein VTG60DRAFT_232 [Thermothelomyces hinnuleus]
MTLIRDEGAPISVSEEQIAKFHEQKDIAGFRAETRASTDQDEKNRLLRKIRATIETCTRLQLEADRQAYFKEADRLRLQGFEPEPTPNAGGPGSGFRRHFTTKYSDKLEERRESAVYVAATRPAGEMQGIYGFEELLRHGMEKHSLGQAATSVAGGKRKRDGDMDDKYTAPAAKRKERGDDGEYTALATVRNMAA